LAKYDKCKFQRKIRSQLQRDEWRRKEPQGGQLWKRKEMQGGNKLPRTIVMFSQETQGFKQAIVGEVNSELEEWLGRSLVCTTKEPKDSATLSSSILHGMGSA